MSDYNPNYVFVKNFFLIGVKLILENSSGEILLLRRSDKVSSAHRWDLPGGAVDAGEGPKQAIIRELREEAGITIPTAQLFSSYLNTEHEDDAIILGFHAKTDTDEVTLSWEHEEYKWMSREEASQIEIPGIYAAMIREYLLH